jgi:hypothetical protein
VFGSTYASGGIGGSPTLTGQVNGASNTGNGGSGANGTAQTPGGNGGSGIVIIRYLT